MSRDEFSDKHVTALLSKLLLTLTHLFAGNVSFVRKDGTQKLRFSCLDKRQTVFLGTQFPSTTEVKGCVLLCTKSPVHSPLLCKQYQQ